MHENCNFCPQCGAPAKEETTECSFCGVGLKSVPDFKFFEVKILRGWDNGIPSGMMAMINLAFRELEEFSSNRAISAFFERESMKLWKYSIPEADSVLNRASFVTAFANNNKRALQSGLNWYDGQSLLLILIIELYGHYHAQSQVPEKLAILVQKLIDEKYLEVS